LRIPEMKKMMPYHKSAYEFHEELKSQGVFFFFNGTLSQNLLKDIIRNIHCRKELEIATRTQLNRIISIVIELLQNVTFYSSEPAKYCGNKNFSDIGDGILMIGRRDDAFFISCGNPVERSKVDIIRAKVERLSSMDRNEIVQFYRGQLNEVRDEEGMGAGLGFIEIAKKSSRPLNITFDRVDEDSSYFSITSYV